MSEAKFVHARGEKSHFGKELLGDESLLPFHLIIYSSQIIEIETAFALICKIE
ncbi:hypothetical protein [Prevotella disiens]|uniref:hypothetical protein n=1 Tax=Prevotella disiens TaxID=28130 RepID=UPI00131F3807|nr:hypothetical protein [Prevotella disiens]